MKNPSPTPICDFLERYRDLGSVRMHMPGHKGQGKWDVEGLDITEIEGADSLYHAEGIIRDSEQIASTLWGAHTYYVTEGSSQAIRAMIHLAALYALQEGKKPMVLAGRNAHSAFVSAVALTDVEVDWLWCEDYLRCPITPEQLATRIEETNASAVYLTSPDYLGNMLDVAALSKVCHEHGALLLVDNAHGAYLKWLSPSLHPMDLGADMCCDSAHKTLPALTGCAYLHLAYGVKDYLVASAKDALALYGSTSPSYLLLASLDALNKRIRDIKQGVRLTARKVATLKGTLSCHGFDLVGDEPCKLTLAPKSWGYTGEEVAAYLIDKGIYPEFSDPDYLVLMPSGSTPPEDWVKV
ncbi:MAG: aminotransferase class V-fold PLP-dependent enzyme, partial [Clostridia bacterium]|nr:aminotransferase class V-fold PLP-dependent enzyme [Clostridia bacterium]